MASIENANKLLNKVESACSTILFHLEDHHARHQFKPGRYIPGTRNSLFKERTGKMTLKGVVADEYEELANIDTLIQLLQNDELFAALIVEPEPSALDRQGFSPRSARAFVHKFCWEHLKNEGVTAYLQQLKTNFEQTKNLNNTASISLAVSGTAVFVAGYGLLIAFILNPIMLGVSLGLMVASLGLILASGHFAEKSQKDNVLEKKAAIEKVERFLKTIEAPEEEEEGTEASFGSF